MEEIRMEEIRIEEIRIEQIPTGRAPAIERRARPRNGKAASLEPHTDPVRLEGNRRNDVQCHRLASGESGAVGRVDTTRRNVVRNGHAPGRRRFVARFDLRPNRWLERQHVASRRLIAF